MTKEAVHNVVGKAATDGAFRQWLFADPDTALAGYELDTAEIAVLRTIDFESIESFAGVLDCRISKGAMFVQAGLA